GVRLRVMMTSFFQSSLEAAELLVAAVRAAAGERALSGVDGRVIDAYGGVGLFAATLLSADVPVTVVESSESSCRDAKVNLSQHIEQTQNTDSPLQGEPGKRIISRSIRVMCNKFCRARWIALYSLDNSTPADREKHLASIGQRVARALR
ncbi:MAG: hypothetical protein EBV40_08350, partial [Actinobacteria bacterium]|nr:hypothetical protein [Actinomycetota bacterium]